MHQQRTSMPVNALSNGTARTFLLIGSSLDVCIRTVQERLNADGHRVHASEDPFDDPGPFRWILGADRPAPPAVIAGLCPDGVLIRAFVGSMEADEYSPSDFSYLQAEKTAALLGYLSSLRCAIVGRRSADTWYRPERPLPEWLGLMARCGLPTPRAAVVSSVTAAIRFTRGADEVTYQPLTSHTQYLVRGLQMWRELENVLEHVPACLVESQGGITYVVTILGDELFWGSSRAAKLGYDANVRRAAAALKSDFLQLEYSESADGVWFQRVHPQPALEYHDIATQQAIVTSICRRLTRRATVQ